jgi:hypothetical protein
VSVEYLAFALNLKNEQVFFLSRDRIQVFEFSLLSGKFVQSLPVASG